MKNRVFQSLCFPFAIIVLVALSFCVGCSKKSVTAVDESSEPQAAVTSEAEPEAKKPSISATAPVEFSADFVQKAPGADVHGKLHVKGDKIRHEMNIPMQPGMSGGSSGKTTIIVRGDKNVAWIINDETKAYIEIANPPDDLRRSPADASEMLKSMEGEGELKRVGQEKVDGHPCYKYEFKFKNESMGTQTHWISKKLGIMVKLEQKAGGRVMSLEHKNIKAGSVSDSLFELPSGYNKMDIPQMPTSMPGPPPGGPGPSVPEMPPPPPGR